MFVVFGYKITLRLAKRRNGLHIPEESDCGFAVWLDSGAAESKLPSVIIHGAYAFAADRKLDGLCGCGRLGWICLYGGDRVRLV